jgi:hypothetical protein
MEEISNANEQHNHCFHYGNNAQILVNDFTIYLCTTINDQNDKIGQVVTMGGLVKMIFFGLVNLFIITFMVGF